MVPLRLGPEGTPCLNSSLDLPQDKIPTGLLKAFIIAILALQISLNLDAEIVPQDT